MPVRYLLLDKRELREHRDPSDRRMRHNPSLPRPAASRLVRRGRNDSPQNDFTHRGEKSLKTAAFRRALLEKTGLLLFPLVTGPGSRVPGGRVLGGRGGYASRSCHEITRRTGAAGRDGGVGDRRRPGP